MRALILKPLALAGLCAVLLAGDCIHAPSEYAIYAPCRCSPQQLNLGQVMVGAPSESATFSLTNTAYLRENSSRSWSRGWKDVPEVSPTLRITGFSSQDCGSEDLPFRVAESFPVVLDEGDTYEFTVEFAPGMPSEWTCQLEPEYEVLNAVYHLDYIFDRDEQCSVLLSGTAIAAPEPACALQPMPPEFDYVAVAVGSSSERILTIRNETPDNLTTNQFKYLLDDPSPDCRLFTIDPADTAEVLGPGEPKDIVVRFEPDAEGDFTCTRSLASLTLTDPPEPIASACPTEVTWRGTGVGGSVPVWGSCASGGNNDWHGVSGLSGTEIYVAGDGGSVLTSGGDCQWSASGTGFSDVNLTDIWAYSGGSQRAIWAVGNIPPPPNQFGETGAILKSDGSQWTKEDEGGFVTYGAVWGSGFDDVYFVGLGVATDFPNARHWTGSAFETLIIDMGMSELTGVSGTSASDVWVVLRQPTYSVYHYDGNQWTNETQSFMDQPLHDVWVTASGEVYAVGEDGAIYHYDGNQWHNRTRPNETRDLYGVWASSTGQVFAVGEEHVIYHYDGNTWDEQTLANLEGDLLDVWGSANDDVYAVGTNGLILRYAPSGG